jgi:hypothetical protein
MAASSRSPAAAEPASNWESPHAVNAMMATSPAVEDVTGQAVTTSSALQGLAGTFRLDAPAAQTTETFRILHGSSSQAK